MALSEDLANAIRRATLTENQIEPTKDEQGAIRGPGGDTGVAVPPPPVEPQVAPGSTPPEGPRPPTQTPTLSREALMAAGYIPPPPDIDSAKIGPTSQETTRAVARQIREAKDSPLYVPEDELEGFVADQDAQLEREAELTREAQTVANFEPETPEEERAFSLIELLSKPAPERTKRENDLVDLYGRQFIDDEGQLVFPDRIQKIFEVASEVDTFVAQREADMKKFMVTTVTNALEETFNIAVENDGSVRLDSILQSDTFRNLNSALGALLGGGSIEPITVINEEGQPETVDLSTAEGLGKAMDSLNRIVAEAGSREVRADAAKTEVFNLVERWSKNGDNILLQTGRPIEFGNFISSQMYGVGMLAGVPPFKDGASTPRMFYLKNSSQFQTAGNLTNLWNRREELGLLMNSDWSKGDNPRSTMKFSSSPEEVERATVALILNEISGYAEENGIPVETALAWTEWSLQNDLSLEDANILADLMDRNGVAPSRGGKVMGLLGDYMELPDKFQKFLMDGLVWMDEVSGPLDIGTAVFEGTQAIANAPVNAIRGVPALVKGDFDEAFTGFIDRHRATEEYMDMYAKLGDEERERLIGAGFGSLWASYASAGDIDRVVADVQAGKPMSQVIENNADTWSRISQIGDELIFDPFNGLLIISGGFSIGLKVGGALAKGTRVAGLSANIAERSPQFARLIEGAGGAAIRGGRGVRTTAQALSAVDPLNLAGNQAIRMLAPFYRAGSPYVGTGIRSVAHLVTDSPLMQSVIQAGARRKEIDLLETVGDQLRWSYRPAQEIGGTIRGIFSEQVPQIFRSYGRTVNNVTVQNAKFQATRRGIAARMAKLAQFEVSDHLRTVYPNGNFLAGSAGRTAADYVNRLNRLYLDMVGSTDTLSADGLASVFRARKSEIREAIGGLIPGRTNLNESLMWLAEHTRNVDLFSDPRIASQTKRLVDFDNLEEIANLKDPVARNVLYQDVKNEWNQALHRIIQEEAQKAMGLTSFSIPEHLIHAMSTPLSYLFLATPRFLIRNALGGHVLAATYRAAPAFGEDGLFALGNLTGRRARAFLDANGVPNLAAVDFLGTTTTRITETNGRRLNTLRKILDFRGHDRRLDQILRTKVFAHQYRIQRDAFRRSIFEGTPDRMGLRDALIDTFKGNSDAADNLIAQFDDLDSLDEVVRFMEDLRTTFANEQEFVRATPSALLGDIPLPPELKGDLHSKLAARMRAIDPTNGEELRRVLGDEIESITKDIQDAIRETEFDDVINLTNEDIMNLAEQWVADVEMLSNIPGVNRQELAEWLGAPNVNLFNRLAHWASDVREEDTMNLVRATIGDKQTRGIFEESYRLYRSQDLTSLRHNKYGIPGKPNAPDEFRAFMYLPEGVEKPTAFKDIPDEWITRDVAEENQTYLSWIRREKFSGEGYEVVGGGLKEISDDTARNYYEELRRLAINRSDDGVPRPFGIQAERIRLSYLRQTQGSLSPQQLSDYYKYVTDLETAYTSARNIKFNERVLTPLREVLQKEDIPVELLPPRASDALGTGLEYVLPLEKVDAGAVRSVLEAQEAAVTSIADAARRAAKESARAMAKGKKPRTKSTMREIEKQWKVLTGSRENLQRADTAQIIMDRMAREAPIERMPPVPELVATAGDEIRRLGYLRMMQNNVGDFLAQRQKSVGLVRPGKQTIVPTGKEADYVYHGSSTKNIAGIISGGLEPRSQEEGIEGLLLFFGQNERTSRNFARSQTRIGNVVEGTDEKEILLRVNRAFFDEDDLINAYEAGVEQLGAKNYLITRKQVPSEAIEVFDEELGAWKTLLPAVEVDSTAFDLSDFLGAAAGDRRVYFTPDATEETLKAQLRDSESRRILELGGTHVTNNPEIPNRVANKFRPRPIKASMPQNLKDALEVWDQHFSELDLDELISRVPQEVALPTPNVAQRFMENVEDARRKVMEIPTVGEHVEANFAAYLPEGKVPVEITDFRQAERWTLAFEEVMNLFQEVQDSKTLKAVLQGLETPSKSRLTAGTVHLNNPLKGTSAVESELLEAAEQYFLRVGGNQTKVRNAMDKLRDAISTGRGATVQQFVAELTAATDGQSVRAFLSSLGHDGIAWRGVDAMGQLVDNLVVFDNSLISPRLAAGDTLPPVSRTFTPDELGDIDNLLTETEQTFRQAEEHAQAGAMEVTNWATHNAFHSTDMDFLARFFFPWEWWMTRTLGKGALRLAERPYLATGYARMYNELNEINSDLPGWMRDRVRVGIPGWPDFLGSGPFFDPTSLIFQFQLEPFEEPGRGPMGEALAWMSGVGLGFNPFLDTALSFTGQMGRFSKETPFPTTGLETWYNAVQNVLHDTGVSFGAPSRVRWTERDRFVLERSLWRLVIQDVNTGANEYSREEIQEALLVIRSELETENPFGAIFNSNLQRTDNVLVQHALNWMRQEELLSNNLSFFTGMLSSARSPLDQAFFERIDELRDELSEAVRLSKGTVGLDGDGGRALREFFQENPDAEFLFLRADATDDLIRSQAVNEYFTGIENFFAPVNSRLDSLPLQGEEATVERRRILASIFDQGPNGEPSKFEAERERLLAENGLTLNDVARDPDFKSTPHSRNLLIIWQDHEFRGDFEGQRAWFNSLTPEDQELLEKEKRNLSTNIGEHIANSLSRITDECENLFRDNNGIVDWGACFRKRDQILQALPPQIKSEVLYAQHQFDSPREVVREVVNEYYIENWLEYISVGRNLSLDDRNAKQEAFSKQFNPPSKDEIINRVTEVAPWFSRDEVLNAYDPKEFLTFPAFVALQNNRNIVDLEEFGEPFEAPSGEIVSPNNFQDYLAAIEARENYNSDKEAGIPTPWTQELEFFFGNGAEGVDVMRRQETVRDWFSRLIDFASGKDSSRALGSFARTIPVLNENMTIEQAFDVLSSLRDRLSFIRDAQFNPWVVVSPGGGQRLLSPEEIDGLSQGNRLPGIPTGFIVRETQNGIESFQDLETAREQAEAEARLNELRRPSSGQTSRGGTQLSKTDILRLLGEGRLKAQDAYERLLRLGYNPSDARLLVESEIDSSGGPTIQRAGQAGEPDAASLRRRAREILGSDRVIDELTDSIRQGRTLSNRSEKDLRLLARMYPIHGARKFEDWIEAVQVLLAADGRGLRITRRGSSAARRQEIRRVRPLR